MPTPISDSTRPASTNGLTPIMDDRIAKQLVIPTTKLEVGGSIPVSG